MSAAKQKKWDAMKPAERRVAIAKDVIAQLHAENYRIEHGSHYLAVDPLNNDDIDEVSETFKPGSENKPITNKQVEVITKNCSMCARGALMLSRIRKFNMLTPNDIGVTTSHGSLFDYADIDTVAEDTTVALKGAFTESQLELIEDAFEGRKNRFGKHGEMTKACPVALWFHIQFEDHTDRLLAIMQNIVDNGGTFKPNQQYEIVNT